MNLHKMRKQAYKNYEDTEHFVFDPLDHYEKDLHDAQSRFARRMTDKYGLKLTGIMMYLDDVPHSLKKKVTMVAQFSKEGHD